MMSIALSTRHAELVSASIPPLAPKGRNDEVTVGLYPRQPALWHDLYWGDVEPAGTLASAPHERRSGLHRAICRPQSRRSEEHTSELQSLMRSSYAVFCLKKKTQVAKHPHKKLKQQCQR